MMDSKQVIVSRQIFSIVSLFPEYIIAEKLLRNRSPNYLPLVPQRQVPRLQVSMTFTRATQLQLCSTKIASNDAVNVTLGLISMDHVNYDKCFSCQTSCSVHVKFCHWVTKDYGHRQSNTYITLKC